MSRKHLIQKKVRCAPYAGMAPEPVDNATPLSDSSHPFRDGVPEQACPIELLYALAGTVLPCFIV